MYIILIAFDQSTSCVGYSVWDYENRKLIDCGKKEFPKLDNLDERIANVKAFINEIAFKYEGEIFCIEQIQYQQNQLTYKILAELLGVLSNNFYEKQFCYQVIEPSKWKAFCGIKLKEKRAIQKKQTIKFIKDKFGIDVSEDEADAIGIGWYAVNCIEVVKEENQ